MEGSFLSPPLALECWSFCESCLAQPHPPPSYRPPLPIPSLLPHRRPSSGLSASVLSHLFSSRSDQLHSPTTSHVVYSLATRLASTIVLGFRSTESQGSKHGLSTGALRSVHTSDLSSFLFLFREFLVVLNLLAILCASECFGDR
ncbi:hypothetical protein BDV18DRAFT_132666 [Aspergillus unguis]